jgi:hypothetical protein
VVYQVIGVGLADERRRIDRRNQLGQTRSCSAPGEAMKHLNEFESGEKRILPKQLPWRASLRWAIPSLNTRSRTGVLGLAALLMIASPCFANVISLAGALDPNNPNDVFLFGFTLTSKSNVTIQSYGYGGSGNATGGKNAAGVVIPAGGFDTYASLFAGLGPAATFLGSNDDGNCPPGAANPACLDSTLQFASLAPGGYTFALTLPFNFSVAENQGSGTLGDGFIGLQSDYFDSVSGTVRTSNFAVDIAAQVPIQPVATSTPEPDLSVLLVGALLAMAGKLKKQSVILNRRTR